MAVANPIGKTNTITLKIVPEELVAVTRIITELGLTIGNSAVDNNGITTMTLTLSDEDYEKLDMRISRYKIKSSVSKAIDSTANLAINTAEYLAKDVAVPVAKIGLKLGAGAGRIAIESAVIAGASTVNVVTEQGKATIQSIKSSDEFNKAKESLKCLGNFIGFSGSGISITKS